MTIPVWIKPGTWGFVVGAAVAMIIGFNWGGWVTGSTASKLASDRAQTAVVAAYTPVCVSNAEHASTDQLAKLKATDSWSRDSFIVQAGWVTNVAEPYREAVATACAPKVIAAMDAAAKPAAAKPEVKTS